MVHARAGRHLDRAGAGGPYLHGPAPARPSAHSLAAPFLPRAARCEGPVSAYFRGPPRDLRHARFRHLTALAAIGWWADQINDQVLRSDVYLNIGVLADAYAAETGDVAFRQVARCARAQLIDANLELERYAIVDRLADNLAKLYPSAIRRRMPIEDWPLLLALRTVSASSRARAPRSRCSRRAPRTIAAVDHAHQPGASASSRLLAAAGRGLMALGDANEGAAARAAIDARHRQTAGTRTPPGAPCRCSTTLRSRRMARPTPPTLQALLRPDQPPPSLNDQQAAFESLLRLSMAAETKEQYDDMGRLAVAGVRDAGSL